MVALNRTAFGVRCSSSERSFEPGARRRIRIHLRPLHRARADRIHANVPGVPFVVMLVANPMVCEALLPYEACLCLTEPYENPPLINCKARSSEMSAPGVSRRCK